LVELLDKLWRRKGLILGTVTVCMLLAAVVILQLTPQYSAAAYIMINSRQARILNVEEVLSALSTRSEAVLSEVRVLQSRQLAANVARKLQLDKNPEFNRTLQPPGLVQRITAPLRNVLRTNGLLSGSPSSGSSGIDGTDDLWTQIVDNFLGRLQVAQDGGSAVIAVRFTSEDRELAAAAVNTLADSYVELQLHTKQKAAERATAFLQKHLSELRNKMLESERAVEVYRAAAGLIRGKDVGLANEEASSLNSQFVEARVRRERAETRWKQVEELVSKSESAASAVEVLQSPLIQALRQQEAEVQRKLAEVSQTVGKKHPQMIAVRAELGNLRAKINSEVARVVEGLHNEVVIARADEAALALQVEKVKGRVGELNQADVKLRALERESDANRGIYQAFLSRSLETGSQTTLVEPDATVVSYADVPRFASFPKTQQLLALSFVLSAFIAVLVVVAKGAFDRRVQSAEQIEEAIGLRPIGIVPRVARGWRITAKPADYILRRPLSAYAESIRMLSTDVALTAPDDTTCVALVTSAMPREGKTVIAASWARAAAQMGKKVILLDCDMRNPSVHRLFGLPREPGLADVLLGQGPLATVIRRDPKSGADVITAGRGLKPAAGLIGSGRIDQVLASLRTTYDLVILDSAPVLAVSETRVLSRLADTTLFLVGWASTHERMVFAALRQLAEAGARLAGVLVTNANLRKFPKYYRGLQRYYAG
jgi:capsular exopolysaccharide synthesis family protein